MTPNHRRAAMRRGREMAWGLFYTSELSGRRLLHLEESYADAMWWHKDFAKRGKNPTKPFKITAPRLTRTRGKGRK